MWNSWVHEGRQNINVSVVVSFINSLVLLKLETFFYWIQFSSLLKSSFANTFNISNAKATEIWKTAIIIIPNIKIEKAFNYN